MKEPGKRGAKWTVAPQHAYFRVALHLGKKPSAVIDQRLIKSVIVSSVHSLYGDVGLPGEVDVLQLLKDKTAVLRVPFDKQRELWSALTLVSDVDGDACTIHVLQTSPFLLSLACSSRAQAGRAVGRLSNTAEGKGGSRAGGRSGDESCLLDMVDPWQQYFDS